MKEIGEFIVKLLVSILFMFISKTLGADPFLVGWISATGYFFTEKVINYFK